MIKTYNNIETCWEAVEACKTIDEVRTLINTFPKCFGEWSIETVSYDKTSPKPYYEVSNCYYDALNSRTITEYYKLSIDVTEASEENV